MRAPTAARRPSWCRSAEHPAVAFVASANPVDPWWRARLAGLGHFTHPGTPATSVAIRREDTTVVGYRPVDLSQGLFMRSEDDAHPKSPLSEDRPASRLRPNFPRPHSQRGADFYPGGAAAWAQSTIEQALRTAVFRHGTARRWSCNPGNENLGIDDGNVEQRKSAGPDAGTCLHNQRSRWLPPSAPAADAMNAPISIEKKR